MKNTLKMFGIIAIAAVIGFWAVSCGDNDGGGGTFTLEAEVVYDPSIENLTEAKKATDFSFIHGYEVSYFLDGTPSVKISSNKVTINLGTPKAAYLETFNYIGLTVNPNNAKIFSMGTIGPFHTSDRKYVLECRKDENNFAVLVYVDRDVTIKGTLTGEEWTDIYNVSLKKGWNFLISSYNEETNTDTLTSSTTQPNGFKWTVVDYYHYYK